MCGHFRHPREFVHNAIAGYCWHCWEWHQHALAIFEGAMPRACQGCGKSYEELERLSSHGDVRVGFHRCDGIYQVMGVACGCDAAYIRKRQDVYGGQVRGAGN
jgi:hypothetical protein